MSALEIVLLVAMVVGLGIYIAISIYDLKHPERKKAKKEQKQKRKEEKRKKKQNKYENTENEDMY